jgi:hypothetical protein
MAHIHVERNRNLPSGSRIRNDGCWPPTSPPQIIRLQRRSTSTYLVLLVGCLAFASSNMTSESLESQVALPTLDRLHTTLPENVDSHQVAASFLRELSSALESQNAESAASLFVDDALWRDMLVLTWNFRTFHGRSRIYDFLKARLGECTPSSFRLADDPARKPTLFTDIPDSYGSRPSPSLKPKSALDLVSCVSFLRWMGRGRHIISIQISNI